MVTIALICLTIITVIAQALIYSLKTCAEAEFVIKTLAWLSLVYIFMVVCVLIVFILM